jgi:hypothetical protein
MNDNNLSDELINALTMKYRSEIQSALATLRIYLKNPVGIGEHPQHLEEMDKLVETMASNNDKLESLKRHFNIAP